MTAKNADFDAILATHRTVFDQFCLQKRTDNFCLYKVHDQNHMFWQVLGVW
jgi:hypothetical protein